MSHIDDENLSDKYAHDFPFHAPQSPALPFSLTTPPAQTRSSFSSHTQAPPSPSLSARFSSLSSNARHSSNSTPPGSPHFQSFPGPQTSPSSIANAAHILQLQAQILQLQAQFLLNPEQASSSSSSSSCAIPSSPNTHPQSPLHSPLPSSPSLHSREPPKTLSQRGSFDRTRLSITNAEVDALLSKVSNGNHTRTERKSGPIIYPKRKSQFTAGLEETMPTQIPAFPRKSSELRTRQTSQKNSSDDYTKRNSLFTPTDDHVSHIVSPRKRSSPRIYPMQDNRPTGGPFQHFIPLTAAFWQVLSVLKFRIEMEASAALEFTSPSSNDVGVTVFANTQANCEHGVRLIHSVIRDDRNGPPGPPRPPTRGSPKISPKIPSTRAARESIPRSEPAVVRDRPDSLSALAAEVSGLVSRRNSMQPEVGSPVLRAQPVSPRFEPAISSKRGSVSVNRSIVEPVSFSRADSVPPIHEPVSMSRTESVPPEPVSMSRTESVPPLPEFFSRADSVPPLPEPFSISRAESVPLLPEPDSPSQSEARKESISHLVAEVRTLLGSSVVRRPSPDVSKKSPPLQARPIQDTDDSLSGNRVHIPSPSSSGSSIPSLIDDVKKAELPNLDPEPHVEPEVESKAAVDVRSPEPDEGDGPSPRNGPASGSPGQWVRRSQVVRRVSDKKDVQRALTHRPETVAPAGRGSLIGKLIHNGWGSEGSLKALERRHSRFGNILPPELKAADPGQKLSHTFGTIMSGVLSKRGKGRIRSWQKRFFMLTRSRLWYYKGNKSLKLAMDITGDTVLQILPGPEEFLVAGLSKEQSYHLMAPTEALRMEWLEAINGLIEDDKASQHFESRFGEIELRLWFNEDSSTLNAIILRGRRVSVNIPKYGKKPANSFLTLLVTGDRKPHKVVKTATAKNTTDPIWKEPFFFHLHDSVITVQTLSIKLLSDEKGKSVVIGVLDIPLINVAFEEKEATNTWYTLHPEKKPIVDLGGSPLLPEPPLSRTGSKSSYSSSFSQSAPVGLQLSRSLTTRGSGGSTSTSGGSFSSNSPSYSLRSGSSTHVRVGSGNFSRSSHGMESSSSVSSSGMKFSPLASDTSQRYPGPPVGSPTPSPHESGSFRRSLTRTSTTETPRLTIQKEDMETKFPGPPDEPRPLLGFVRTSVWYDSNREKLLVDIRECFGLPPSLLPRDPFIELRLLPVEPNVPHPVLKTKVQRKTLEPLFDERFEFSVEQHRLGFKLLSLSVMDRGGTFGKDKIIGEVIIPLDTIPRTSQGATQDRVITAVSSTVFEINQLGDLLLLEPGFQSFLAMLTKEHSRENLLFWKAVQDFRSQYLDASTELRPACMREAVDIVARFIQSGADFEINVPSTIKAQIQAALTEETVRHKYSCETLASIFDFAQAEVLDLMSRDTFGRYLVSKEWGAFCDYLAQERTEKELGYRVVNMISAYGQTLKSRGPRSGSSGEPLGGRMSVTTPVMRTGSCRSSSSTMPSKVASPSRPWSTTYRKKSNQTSDPADASVF